MKAAIYQAHKAYKEENKMKSTKARTTAVKAPKSPVRVEGSDPNSTLDRFQTEVSRASASLFDVDNFLSVVIGMMQAREPEEFQKYDREEFSSIWYGAQDILKRCREILEQQWRRLDEAETEFLLAKTGKREAA